MKKAFFIILMALSASMTFVSCEDGKKEKKVTAKVLSAPYELLIVAPKAWLATGDGIEFRNIVERPILGIPQAEPNFRVTTLEPRDYKGKYTMYGNIFMMTVNPDVEKSSMDIQYNVNAKPQVIVKVEGPTSNSIMVFLESRKDSILDAFVQHELVRERSFLVKKHSGQVLEQTKKLFGMQLYAPEDIETVTPHENFYWATSKKRDNALNVCMYTYPYVSDGSLSSETFVQKRDSVMRPYIQGDREDQFMKTDERYIYTKLAVRNGRQVLEARGLWYMVNDAMGGPFVSYSYIDEKNSQVVVVEGFIYAPEEKKRPLIRELEACLQTLVLPSEKK